MGGRSSSFRSRKNSGRTMPSVPTLHGSKDQIAQAEKIRKPYADALKNLDEDTIIISSTLPQWFNWNWFTSRIAIPLSNSIISVSRLF